MGKYTEQYEVNIFSPANKINNPFIALSKLLKVIFINNKESFILFKF